MLFALVPLYCSRPLSPWVPIAALRRSLNMWERPGCYQKNLQSKRAGVLMTINKSPAFRSDTGAMSRLPHALRRGQHILMTYNIHSDNRHVWNVRTLHLRRQHLDESRHIKTSIKLLPSSQDAATAAAVCVMLRSQRAGRRGSALITCPERVRVEAKAPGGRYTEFIRVWITDTRTRACFFLVAESIWISDGLWIWC